MFAGETHKPQLLDSASYFSDDRFEAEKEAVLDSAWYCVGSLSDIPNVGDYFTLEILEHPVLIRRTKEGVRAFLNVCSHRFCTLTSQRHGSASQIKCQYHGWEYGDDGQTKRIPDAPSFKPLKKGELGLSVFRCETRAGLIFVSLDPNGVSLDTFLDGRGSLIDEWFTERWETMMSYEDVAQCNWKTYIENGLESYHIDTVHAATLANAPDAEHCSHDFSDRSSRFSVDQEAPDAVSRWMDKKVHDWLELPRQPYQHVHVYPSFTFIRMSGFSYLESIIPISGKSSSVITRGFSFKGQRDRWYSNLLSKLTRRWGSRFLKKIQDEDLSILKLNQAGMQSPEHPKGGLISIREERIFHFQNYLLSQTKSNTTQEHISANTP